MISDEQLVANYAQACDNLAKAKFVSISTVLATVLAPLGFLVPFGPPQARILFCVMIIIAVALFMVWVRWIHSFYVPVRNTRAALLLRKQTIYQEQHPTVIRAEPTYR